MKKHAVFSYPYYYPNGGMHDLKLTTDSFEEAMHFAHKWTTDSEYDFDNILEIYDLETFTKIFQKTKEV